MRAVIAIEKKKEIGAFNIIVNYIYDIIRLLVMKKQATFYLIAKNSGI